MLDGLQGADHRRWLGVIGLHQQHARGRRPDPGEGASVAGKLLFHLLRRKHGVHAGGDGPEPVHRPKRLDQDYRSRSPGRIAGPGGGHGRRISFTGLSADHDQVGKLGVGSACRVVLPSAETNLVTRVSKLLGDPVADRSWPHDHQCARGRSSRLCRTDLGNFRLGQADRSRQAVHDRSQLLGVTWCGVAREPVLGFSGNRADVQKAVGSPGSGQTMESGLEGVRGVPVSLPKLGNIGAQLGQARGHGAQVFALQLLERGLDWIAHGDAPKALESEACCCHQGRGGTPVATYFAALTGSQDCASIIHNRDDGHARPRMAVGNDLNRVEPEVNR